MTDTRTSYLGLRLKNPIIAASSGMTRDLSRLRKCAETGFGAAVMKSLFEDEIARDDPAPHYSLIPRGDATVFYSFEQASNWGPDRYATEIRKANRELDIPIIPSINCVTPDGWRDYALRMQDAGAPAIELNVSCPYGSVTSSGSQAEAKMFDAVESAMDAVSIPIAVKLPGRLTSPEAIVAKLESMGVKGVVIFNRFAGLDININNEKPIMHGGAAGHGGEFSLHYPLLWVSRLSSQCKISIAGSGGVSSASDIIKYLLAGANAVQVCTLIYMNGYEVIHGFLAGLKKWMDDRNYRTVSAFRGHVSGEKVLGVHDINRTKSVEFKIDTELCTSCDLCRQRCPYEAISNEEGYYEIVPQTCVSCGLCEQICPIDAIRLLPVEE